MTARTRIHGLQVADELYQFINAEVLPGTGVAQEAFWKGFDALVADLAPKNAALLAERDRLQTELDTWHKANPGPIRDMAAYRKFLETIGYLVAPPQGVQATTRNVDAELAILDVYVLGRGTLCQSIPYGIFPAMTAAVGSPVTGGSADPAWPGTKWLALARRAPSFTSPTTGVTCRAG